MLQDDFRPRLTRMAQDIFRPLTRMEQNMFITKINPDNLTFMEQGIFKRNEIIIKDEIEIEQLCLQSFPCKHNIKINGIEFGLMDGKEIVKKYWNFLGPQQKEHFKVYLDKIGN